MKPLNLQRFSFSIYNGRMLKDKAGAYGLISEFQKAVDIRLAQEILREQSQQKLIDHLEAILINTTAVIDRLQLTSRQ